MPGLAEIIGSITGAYLLATRDLDGFKLFNLTIEGFWRSFAALLLIAPFYFLFAGLELELQSQAQVDGEAVSDHSGYYAGRVVALIVDWIAYPVVMVFVARGLGFAHHYVRYIIVFNWSSVIVFGLLMLPTAAFHLGAISAEHAGLLNLLFLVPVLYYRWFLAKAALETTGLVATGLVLLELTLSVAIARYSTQLIG